MVVISNQRGCGSPENLLVVLVLFGVLHSLGHHRAKYHCPAEEFTVPKHRQFRNHQQWSKTWVRQFDSGVNTTYSSFFHKKVSQKVRMLLPSTSLSPGAFLGLGSCLLGLIEGYYVLKET